MCAGSLPEPRRSGELKGPLRGVATLTDRAGVTTTLILADTLLEVVPAPTTASTLDSGGSGPLEEVVGAETAGNSPVELPLGHIVEKSSFRTMEVKGRGPSDSLDRLEAPPFRPFRVEQVCGAVGPEMHRTHTSGLDSNLEESF